MSKNLFLIEYDEQKYCDETSETLCVVEIDDYLFNKLKEFSKECTIAETRSSPEELTQCYIEVSEIRNLIDEILIPEYVRRNKEGAVNLDNDNEQEIVDKDIERIMLKVGVVCEVLKLLKLKKDNFEYKDNVVIVLE